MFYVEGRFISCFVLLETNKFLFLIYLDNQISWFHKHKDKKFSSYFTHCIQQLYFWMHFIYFHNRNQIVVP